MSIELAIQENTAAIKALIAALTIQSVTAQKVEKPVKVVKATPEPVVEVAPAPEPVVEASLTGDDDLTGAPVTLDDVSAIILSIAKSKGREAALGLLGQFGAAKTPQLKADDYAAVVKAGQAILDAA